MQKPARSKGAIVKQRTHLLRAGFCKIIHKIILSTYLKFIIYSVARRYKFYILNYSLLGEKTFSGCVASEIDRRQFSFRFVFRGYLQTDSHIK